MKNALIAAVFAAGFGLGPAHAQTTSDPVSALNACVSGAVTTEDSVTTARWLFIAMSRHPSLPQSVRVSDTEGLEANRRMGALVNRLLLDACAQETRAAVSAAGHDAAFHAAFGTLGEKAMADLMGNTDVLASIIQLGAYVDRDRLSALAATP
jgi:hypothetical protein